ncbi:MBL fold metallo-hydrolase [Segetibacter sp. 3557_3]|uniref:MBL fold metallo-hydrolase n=1 Tax=Segetibacter sp. 3557_3 TaxID=2547429 RepID=UPI0010589A93|nr:MBL fold metallo-hydrolase [Segetibacter sp. 3557_3]TDH26578.1 MBL fold metallo-hydrolase [Segetibacter sp. 3557_3]
MQDFICTTCGIQYEPADKAPEHCPICEDERQYLNPGGHSFTSLEQVNRQHKNVIEQVTPTIYAIYSTPTFAIGQRAHLVLTPGGNILWDCITNIDSSTISLINALGGIKAIAISHPHFYSTMVEWSKAFNAPLYINEADRVWLGRTGEKMIFWQQEATLWDGIKLVQCGGHFEGSAVMHLPGNGGALFAGDTLQVAPDLKTVSFMYSYPNLVPLAAPAINRIEKSLEKLEYERVYGAFGRYLLHNAKASVAWSIERYRKIYSKDN